LKADDGVVPVGPHRRRKCDMPAPTERHSFTTTLSVDQSPEEVFAAIVNWRGWWSENIDGPTDIRGQAFTYRHRDVHHCTLRVSEMTSPTRVAWHQLHQ
jgi:hypothetical protein